MKKILIIEDDLIDQMAFVRMIKKQNLELQYTVAKSIQEAKSILSKEKYDLVISDHNLADGTTFDLLDDIKNTPFILISGNEDQSTIKSVESKLGAIACFTKDLDLNYLKELPLFIQNFFDQKTPPSSQQNEDKNQVLQGSKITHEEVIVDLNVACKIFDGKKQEVKESIELFIFHKPREMENLYSYLNNRDYKNAAKTAHLMKSGFRLFGMKTQVELANQIEKEAQTHNDQLIFEYFKKLSTNTKIAIELLKKELPSL